MRADRHPVPAEARRRADRRLDLLDRQAPHRRRARPSSASPSARDRQTIIRLDPELVPVRALAEARASGLALPRAGRCAAGSRRRAATAWPRCRRSLAEQAGGAGADLRLRRSAPGRRPGRRRCRRARRRSSTSPAPVAVTSRRATPRRARPCRWCRRRSRRPRRRAPSRRRRRRPGWRVRLARSPAISIRPEPIRPSDRLSASTRVAREPRRCPRR